MKINYVRGVYVSMLFLTLHEGDVIRPDNFMSGCLYFPNNLKDIKADLKIYITRCEIFPQ